MKLIFAIPVTMTALAAMAVVLGAGRRLEQTTLTTSWRWATASITACTGAWILDGLLQTLSDEWARLMWLANAILLLCPAIAVLGARRPGSRAWNWFVLVPLAAVLGWPALTIWGSGGKPGMLQLEGPALIGFVLAGVMGIGNYLGTRYRGAALLVGCAEILILLPLTSFQIAGVADPWWLRLAGMAALAIAVLIARRAADQDARFPLGVDRVWSEFRDTFGIVWAQRVQERVNARSIECGWPVRLAGDRFQWETGRSPPAAQEARTEVEQTLRWLLRRFVNESWLDSRLGASGT